MCHRVRLSLKHVFVQVSMEPSVLLEVENEVSVVAGSRLSQLRCSRDGRDWNTLLPSSVVTAAGSRWDTSLLTRVDKRVTFTFCK